MSWDWEKLKEQQQKRGDIPTQMNEFFERLSNFNLPGGPLVVFLIILFLLATTMVYKVDPSEVGVIQRFGRFVRLTQPGLHFKLPVGIEKVTKVNVRLVETEEFSENAEPLRGRFSASNSNITLMLTGDLNVALVPWIVQYRIKDPYNYLFKVNQVKTLLRDMSEASMRLVIGDRSIDEVISKRDEIAFESQQLLQDELNQAETGIEVVTIEMKKTDVPGPVQPSLNEVNQSTQEREQTIYKAREEYNKAIPAARGEAARIIQEAEGYALDRVNRAQGDVSRFQQIYEEYVKAVDITKRRLYLEALKDVMPRLEKKYIIDAEMQNLLPLLNLGERGGVEK